MPHHSEDCWGTAIVKMATAVEFGIILWQRLGHPAAGWKPELKRIRYRLRMSQLV